MRMLTKSSFKDFAIILTWPDATIRGDESWMMFFKKLGIVKNLNFKVGHTGIIIIDHTNGDMLYYDFGRYISPRGYGRARSKFSDPLLNINAQARIENNKIVNINEIIEHLESLKSPMYGEGKLYFSIVKDINFSTAKQYGDECVTEGTYPYGAVAKNNNNCSRFITRMLMKSSRKYNFWHSLNFPESIKASPISNLVNTSSDRIIYSYTPQEGVKSFKMNRFQSLAFLIKQLGDNVNQKKALQLPDDNKIGAMKYKSKPLNIPTSATYLGGVGDGAWYSIQRLKKNHFIIKRYTTKGIKEYTVLGVTSHYLPLDQQIEITYDSHLLFTHVLFNKKKIKINHIKQLDVSEENNSTTRNQDQLSFV